MDDELKYNPIEKQAYALINSLKSFRIYILHAKVLSYVHSVVVKDVLTQPDIDGKRAKWIVNLIDFDIEVNPTKLVKGQGLAKLMAEENCDILGMNFICITSANMQREIAAKVAAQAVQEQNDSQQVAENLSSCEWQSSIIHFLQKL